MEYPTDTMVNALYVVMPYLDSLDRLSVSIGILSQPTKKPPKPDMASVLPLPPEYNNWDATVIFFIEDTEKIYVYAVDTNMCTIYLITDYKPKRFLYRSVGYTSGDRKVFFVGEIISPLDPPLEVTVYDIGTRKFSSLPAMKSFKLDPLVFYINKKLFVLSTSGIKMKDQFEMFDVADPSQGWATLTPPPYLSRARSARPNQHTIDYDKKMLYIRLNDCYCYSPDVYGGYSYEDNIWQMSYDLRCSDTSKKQPNRCWIRQNCTNFRGSNKYPAPSNITSMRRLRAPWSDTCAIAGHYMYSFLILFSVPPKRHANLIIRDLDHQIEDDFLELTHYPPIQWMVDISDIVPKEVLKDLRAVGHLVHLPSSDSNAVRFSLIIHSQYWPGPAKVHTCTFSVTESSTPDAKFTVGGVLCCSKHVEVVPGKLSCVPLDRGCKLTC